MKPENISGKFYNSSGNVFQYLGEQNYGVSLGANPIPLSMIEQILNDIDFDFSGLDIKFFNFDHRLMLVDSRTGNFTGAEYNGQAFPTHVIVGARREKDIKLGGASGIGGLIIHELGHSIMYKAMNCTWDNHMSNTKFKEYMKLREIPSVFTDKSVWEKRPAEIFAEDFRFLFGDSYMKEEAFLPYTNISEPTQKIRQFMIELMTSIGVKEKISIPVVEIKPDVSDIVIKPVEPIQTTPTTKPSSTVIKTTNSDTSTVPNFLLILNGGHGINTSGKRTPLFTDGTFIHENQFNDAVVAKIKYICEKMGVEYYDVSTETEDVGLSTIVSREKSARKVYLTRYPKGKTVFLSVHYNAMKDTFDGSTASGMEVWYYETSVEGKKIAQIIHDELKVGTKQVDRGIKPTTGLYVLKNTSSPAVLIECGFMDDPTEAKLMLDPKFHNEVALESFNAIMKYTNLPTTGYNIFTDEIVAPEKPPVVIIPPVVIPSIPTKENALKLVKTRFKSTDIYYVEIPMSEYWIYPTLGTPKKLEKLSEIVSGFESRNKVDVRVACNAGFFNLNGSAEHLGNFLVNFGKEPVYQYSPSTSFIDFVAYKDGTFECKKESIQRTALIAMKPKVNFAIGASYALIIEGNINTFNAEKFSHSRYDNPRTMVGWNKRDNTFVIAVADGRTKGNLGLTAKEEADFMMSKFCYVAVNFDGGGSSELIFDNGADRDIIANKPSDGVERRIGSALVVYKK